MLVFFVLSWTTKAQTDKCIVCEEPYYIPFDTMSFFKQCLVCEEPYIILFDAPTSKKDSLSQENTKFTKNLRGIDVSRWQGIIRWPELEDDSIVFCFIKATGGLKTDECFSRNWETCPFRKGAYHFFSPLINGEDQARHFLNIVKLKPGDLPPVIDIEYTSYYRHVHPKIFVKNLQIMLDYIEDQIGIRPIIYTNPNFWNRYIHPYFNNKEYKYQLWVATYRTENPILPKGWDTWFFWQYSDRGTFKNLFGPYDMNLYNGSFIDEILLK